MKFIIDNRMRKEEKGFFKTLGDIIEIPKVDTLYSEISSHPDIFVSKIGNKIICAPCIYDYLKSYGIECIKGNKDPESNYPNDILYNVCQIGKYVIGNFKYVDQIVLDEILSQNLDMINVNQGYSNCSCLVLNDNTIITSDRGIYNTLIKFDLDVLFLSTNNIKLLKNDNFYSDMKGFIGGATFAYKNLLILFGDINKIEEKEKLISFLTKHSIELIQFSNLDVIDYGGVLFT